MNANAHATNARARAVASDAAERVLGSPDLAGLIIKGMDDRELARFRSLTRASMATGAAEAGRRHARRPLVVADVPSLATKASVPGHAPYFRSAGYTLAIPASRLPPLTKAQLVRIFRLEVRMRGPSLAVWRPILQRAKIRKLVNGVHLLCTRGCDQTLFHELVGVDSALRVMPKGESATYVADFVDLLSHMSRWTILLVMHLFGLV